MCNRVSLLDFFLNWRAEYASGRWHESTKSKTKFIHKAKRDVHSSHFLLFLHLFFFSFLVWKTKQKRASNQIFFFFRPVWLQRQPRHHSDELMICKTAMTYIFSVLRIKNVIMNNASPARQKKSILSTMCPEAAASETSSLSGGLAATTSSRHRSCYMTVKWAALLTPTVPRLNLMSMPPPLLHKTPALCYNATVTFPHS